MATTFACNPLVFDVANNQSRQQQQQQPLPSFVSLVFLHGSSFILASCNDFFSCISISGVAIKRTTHSRKLTSFLVSPHAISQPHKLVRPAWILMLELYVPLPFFTLDVFAAGNYLLGASCFHEVQKTSYSIDFKVLQQYDECILTALLMLQYKSESKYVNGLKYIDAYF